MKRRVVVIAVALLLGSRALMGQAPASDARGIHDAFLKELFKGTAVPESYIVSAEFRAVVSPTQKQWDALGPGTDGLQRKVATVPAAAALDATDVQKPENFPGGAHILPRAEITALIRSAPVDRDGYPALQQRYQTRSILWLSKPIVTDDGRDVLLYWIHGCGSLCGSGGYGWLHRATPRDPWVVKLLVTMMS